MSLFKDLIDELKEENLLEETIEEHLAKNADADTLLGNEEPKTSEVNLDSVDLVFAAASDDEYGGVAAESPTSVALFDSQPVDPYEEEISENSFEIVVDHPEESNRSPILPVSEAPDVESVHIPSARSDFDESYGSVIESESQPSSAFASDLKVEFRSDTEPQLSSEFENETGSTAGSVVENAVLEKPEYVQRLMKSVKSLQHVQQIISGVQREQMRDMPITYDTVAVKQALHKFAEAYEKSDVSESSAAESVLHEEIGKWHAILLGVDRKISVAHLRKYCEVTNPPLSDEAVTSLARFYRNSPFNEDARSKFDLVITRLFSKKVEDGKRTTVLHRDEILTRVKDLYAEWASVSLYNDENEDSEIILTAFKFEDFVVEANKVKTFDELIRNGFFKRIKNLKEKLQENFFSPLLVAVAVECNVLIGNRYVDLIHAEQKKAAERNASRKSRKSQENPAEIISKPEGASLADLESMTSGGIAKMLLDGKRKWFTIAALASVLLTVSLFTFGAFTGKKAELAESPFSKGGAAVNLEKSSFNSYIKSARIKGDMFFGTTTTAWDNLPYSKKEEMMKKLQLAGTERGYSQVQLLNPKGESVGFGSESGVNVIE